MTIDIHRTWEERSKAGPGLPTLSISGAIEFGVVLTKEAAAGILAVSGTDKGRSLAATCSMGLEAEATTAGYPGEGGLVPVPRGGSGFVDHVTEAP